VVTGQHLGRPGGQAPPPSSLEQQTPPVGPHDPAGSCVVAGQQTVLFPLQQTSLLPHAPRLQTQTPFTQVRLRLQRGTHCCLLRRLRRRR
jgi:hypothetical protein